MRTRTQKTLRRGAALLAVLVVVTVGALVGTSLLYAADAGRESAAVLMRTEQSRLLAWSGVQAVMAELSAQREDLLGGEPPRVTSSWVFEGEEGSSETLIGPRYVYRLRSIGEAEIVSEAGKLDVNHASAEMLAKLSPLDEALAARIVSARPFASVTELTRVEGISEEMLIGGGVDPDAGVGLAPGGELPRGLTEFLTAFSFDPNVQTGIGDNGADSLGERRLNLNTPWTEELGAAVERRLGPEAAAALKGAMQSETTFRSDSDIVKQLRAIGVPTEDWGEILDVFTTSESEYVLGRISLLTAPVEVLACVPGIDEETAARIIGRRDKVEPELRRSVCWPVVDGVMTPEQFTEAVDHLTVRSMQWRVVIEAGTLAAAGSEGSGLGLPRIGGPGSAAEDELGGSAEWELSDTVLLEAVIDVSSRRPRVAYLRDITMLPVARAVRTRAMLASEGREQGDGLAFSARPSLPGLPAVESVEVPAEEGAAPAGPSAAPWASRRGRSPDPPAPTAVEDGPSAEPADSAPLDGRIGRWTAGRGDRQ